MKKTKADEPEKYPEFSATLEEYHTAFGVALREAGSLLEIEQALNKLATRALSLADENRTILVGKIQKKLAKRWEARTKALRATYKYGQAVITHTTSETMGASLGAKISDNNETIAFLIDLDETVLMLIPASQKEMRGEAQRLHAKLMEFSRPKQTQMIASRPIGVLSDCYTVIPTQ